MTDVETVARALAAASDALWDAANFNHTLGGETPEEMRDSFMHLAAAALAAATPLIEARVQRETIDALNQPGSMQVHMLRGTINPMPLRDCLHLHCITAKDNWGALTIDEALAIAAAAAIRKG